MSCGVRPGLGQRLKAGPRFAYSFPPSPAGYEVSGLDGSSFHGIAVAELIEHPLKLQPLAAGARDILAEDLLTACPPFANSGSGRGSTPARSQMFINLVPTSQMSSQKNELLHESYANQNLQ